MPDVCIEEHEHEWKSQCCGKEPGNILGMCPQCRDWTGFECECGKEYPS